MRNNPRAQHNEVLQHQETDAAPLVSGKIPQGRDGPDLT